MRSGAKRSVFRCWWAGIVALLAAVVVPGLGAWWLTDRRLGESFGFPPEPLRWEPLPPFAPWAPFAVVILVLGLSAWWIAGRRRGAAQEGAVREDTGRAFPWWGWLCAGLVGSGWVLAWTRFPWFAGFQPYTYLMLWYPFIGLLQALSRWLLGWCPLERDGVRFWALFPLSAAFWWLFEHLNRFSGNWLYNPPASFSEVDKMLLGSVSFATVLPAVYSVRVLLEWWSGLQQIAGRGPVVRGCHGQVIAGLIGSVSFGALLLLGLFPAWLYPALWLAPLGLFLAVGIGFGATPTVGDLRRGDWRAAFSWMLAALICGFFWEMWNAGSQLRWEYEIPFQERFFLFAMPLAGYTGYLPFGLECALIVQALYGREPVLDQSITARNGSA